MTNLNDGVAYYFALTALDTEGFESGKSNEVSYTPPASQFTLSVSNSGTGTGTVTGTGISCGTDCSEAYTTGTSVSLTAAAAVSSTFTGWTGALQRDHQSLHGHHECQCRGDGRLRY